MKPRTPGASLPRRLPWLLSASALLSAAAAHEGTAQVISGTVVDAQSGEAVATASVTLLDAEHEMISTVLTGAAGDFVLQARGEGTYRLEVGRLGYHPKVSEPFELGREGRREIELRLTPEAIALDSIVVTVSGTLIHEGTVEGLYARRARAVNIGRGRVWVRGDPEFDNSQTVEDVFLRAFTRRNCFRDPPYPFLFVDGRELPSREIAPFLVMPVHFLEGVEVYRTLTAAPLDLRPFGGLESGFRRCGIVAIWLRGMR